MILHLLSSFGYYYGYRSVLWTTCNEELLFLMRFCKAWRDALAKHLVKSRICKMEITLLFFLHTVPKILWCNYHRGNYCILPATEMPFPAWAAVCLKKVVSRVVILLCSWYFLKALGTAEFDLSLHRTDYCWLQVTTCNEAGDPISTTNQHTSRSWQHPRKKQKFICMQGNE